MMAIGTILVRVVVTRTVAFEADDERWDGTVVTEAVEVLDETGTDVYNVLRIHRRGFEPW